MRWNELAAWRHCQKTGNQLFICNVEDTIKGHLLTGVEKAALANQRTSSKKKSKQELPAVVELAIGMKVMVTTNVETDLNITNGARGMIADIILHPNEEYSKQEKEIVLKYVPLYLLIKLKRTRATLLKGLEETVIPVEAHMRSMHLQVVDGKGKNQRCSVK
ncbi:hypothetical protein SCLCIDRAFT_128970 [Scleroderma citrinum Foug A]|uniref:DNA helicase n=1 Tax=Scleroderma citrinum Foug A TaxID=1036808 RepID=A0A0C3DBT5_9AGAM|nr:hypothetical protein SCLCIDRAFT_128970 [Scleroderma citrinum Foug A]